MESSENLLNFNVGVLGHVDSGKTTLSKSLSTVASTASFDKNPQSKERGITLDLGFSSFYTNASDHFRVQIETESGKKIDKIQYTLVDCPGHASLIKTIIGGAQIIDLMLLVVDITKGFQTQTSECLIIGHITCSKMIVVLNKIDMIEEEKRKAAIEKMEKRIQKTLEKTKFAGCSIVPVSAAPGGSEDNREPLGMDRLVAELSAHTYLPKRQITGPFIFSVDHCFSIRGQGTVMTGTVLSGQVSINSSVEIPSLKVTKKVKSMQMFKKPVEKAIQGDRPGLCVTQFDPKLLERGLVCEPGALPTITAAIISIRKIPYFKGAISTKAKFHVTIGHDTVMAKLSLFSHESDVNIPDSFENLSDDNIDFTKDYKYRDELTEFSAKNTETNDISDKTTFHALLELEKPITCPKSSVVIGSKLDTDIHTNTCRIAFHGRLVEIMTSSDYVNEMLPKLRVYKLKLKEGFVERVHDNETVIVRDLFKKESNVDAFVNLKVVLSSGERGIISGTFGKSGKINVRIPDGVSSTTKAQYENVGKKKSKSKQETENSNVSANFEPIKVLLTFKRYIYDQSKKMIQN